MFNTWSLSGKNLITHAVVKTFPGETAAVFEALAGQVDV
jgi:hypothetical protein